MKGITNAPQGSGGSGGTWTRRTANDNWSDLFTVTETVKITANKTMIIYDGDTGGEKFIPKGAYFTSSLDIPLSPNIGNISGSPEKKRILKNARLKFNNVASGSLYRQYVVITFANDGTSTLESGEEAYAKANTIIYTYEE